MTLPKVFPLLKWKVDWGWLIIPRMISIGYCWIDSRGRSEPWRKSIEIFYNMWKTKKSILQSFIQDWFVSFQVDYNFSNKKGNKKMRLMLPWCIPVINQLRLISSKKPLRMNNFWKKYKYWNYQELNHSKKKMVSLKVVQTARYWKLSSVPLKKNLIHQESSRVKSKQKMKG